MASANSSQTIDSTGVNVFDQANDGGPCVGFMVAVKGSSANPALVNIPGLHKSGEFFPIPIGISVTFEDHTQGDVAQQIQTVFVKGDGGDTLVDSGVVSRNIPVR